MAAATTAAVLKREAASRCSLPGSGTPAGAAPWVATALRLLIALSLNVARAEKEGEDERAGWTLPSRHE